eukprot:SAG31_NODE_5243_length_2654_cov_3.037965_3_plen_67_part_01
MATLNLRSILYLCPEDPPEYYLKFMREHNIQLLHFGMAGNKEPFVEIPERGSRAPAAASAAAAAAMS